MKTLCLLSKYTLLLWACSALWACKDPRPDQSNNNLFDPNNAFVRFNFGNTVNGTAQDSVLIRQEAGTERLRIPVALSSPPLSQALVLRFELQISGAIAEGEDFVLLENGQTIENRSLRIAPGQFDTFLDYQALRPAATTATVQLRLIEATPNNIRLGFPGSGRGTVFTIIIIP